MSGRKEIKIGPALQRVARGTFSPKYEKNRSLSTASAIAVGPTRRDAVLYFTLTSPIGALARTLELVSGATKIRRVHRRSGLLATVLALIRVRQDYVLRLRGLCVVEKCRVLCCFFLATAVLLIAGCERLIGTCVNALSGLMYLHTDRL